MEEFSGTPGPWLAEYSKENDAYEIAPMRFSGKGIDWDREVCITADNSIENARLIAAAPELLEALLQLRNYVVDVCCVSTEDCNKEHPLMLATSTIAKALGK
ncbi:MAG TPA: hypothetical protein DCM53_19970 [Enterobacteriaceae bacterium]|nr:hypothetical protein [Enterobacteriaceae bacterium]